MVRLFGLLLLATSTVSVWNNSRTATISSVVEDVLLLSSREYGGHLEEIIYYLFHGAHLSAKLTLLMKPRLDSFQTKYKTLPSAAQNLIFELLYGEDQVENDPNTEENVTARLLDMYKSLNLDECISIIHAFPRLQQYEELRCQKTHPALPVLPQYPQPISQPLTGCNCINSSVSPNPNLKKVKEILVGATEALVEDKVFYVFNKTIENLDVALKDGSQIAEDDIIEIIKAFKDGLKDLKGQCGPEASTCNKFSTTVVDVLRLLVKSMTGIDTNHNCLENACNKFFKKEWEYSTNFDLAKSKIDTIIELIV